jgi:hypothetical protein
LNVGLRDKAVHRKRVVLKNPPEFVLVPGAPEEDSSLARGKWPGGHQITGSESVSQPLPVDRSLKVSTANIVVVAVCDNEIQ